VVELREGVRERVRSVGVRAVGDGRPLVKLRVAVLEKERVGVRNVGDTVPVRLDCVGVPALFVCVRGGVAERVGVLVRVWVRVGDRVGVLVAW